MQQRGPSAWQRRGLDGYRLKREVDRLQENPTWHTNDTGRVPDHGGSGVRMGVGEGGGGLEMVTSWRSGTWIPGFECRRPCASALPSVLGQGLRRQSCSPYQERPAGINHINHPGVYGQQVALWTCTDSIGESPCSSKELLFLGWANPGLQ